MYKRQLTICYFKCGQENILPLKVITTIFPTNILFIVCAWLMVLSHLKDLDKHLIQRKIGKTYLLRLIYVQEKDNKKTFLPTKVGCSLNLPFWPTLFFHHTNFYLDIYQLLTNFLNFLCISSFPLSIYRFHGWVTNTLFDSLRWKAIDLEFLRSGVQSSSIF